MAGLRPGESFLTAATRDRKAADKRAAAKREAALVKAEANAAAKSWAAPRSIFIPPAFTKPPPKKAKSKNVMPGTEYQGDDKRTASQRASDHRRAEVRKLVKKAGDRRDFSLGVNKQKQAPNIYDAVPVGRTKQDQSITRALDHPPPTLSPRELRDWKKKLIGYSTLPPAEKRQRTQEADAEYVPPDNRSVREIGEAVGGLAEHVAKGVGGRVADFATDVAGAALSGGQPTNRTLPVPASVQAAARGAEPFTRPTARAAEYVASERGAEAFAGKALTNAVLHGDMPGTLGEAGGLAAGVLTLGPAGKATRAIGLGGKLAFDAIKAEQGIKAAVAAGKAGAKAGYEGPSVASKVIQWGRTSRNARVGRAYARDVRANAGMLVDMRRTALAAGNEDTAKQIEQILAKADLGPNGEFHGWDEAVTAKRVASKTNQKNIEKGIPYLNPVTESATSPGIVVAGPVTNEQWFAKMVAAFPTQGERQQWAQWYDEFAPAFREMFGEQAEELMRGFAVSQANNSPTGGLLATLRVLDRLQAGDSAKTITNKGIGTASLIKTISKAVEGADGKVDEGVAAKLSDFIDSFLKKDTRTFMGDHVDGGKPSAIDVHAMRDLGLIDKKLAAKLIKVHGLKQITKDQAAKRGVQAGEFVVDSQGAASGPLYERLSERYEEIARFLNDMNDGAGFDGRNNWEPREVQALGWGATQKTHGVDPENLGTAFTANTRRYNLGATPGLGVGLSHQEVMGVADAIAPHIDKIVSEVDGVFPVKGILGGIHQAKGAPGLKAGAQTSLHLQVMGSPEKAQRMLDRLATNFPGFEVWAYKIGGGFAKPALRIRNIPDSETAARVFESLRAQDPKKFNQGYHFADGEIVAQMAGKNVTAAERESFAESMAPAISKAADEAGIPADHALQYEGSNIQILRGKPDGEAGVPGTRSRRLRGRTLEGHTDAEARAAYDDAVRRINGTRAQRAAATLRGERGAVDVGGFRRPGRVAPEPVPRPGVVGPGGDLPRFASTAEARTAETVAARIAKLDSQLDPIVDDIAKGLKQEGIGKGARESLAKTDKPDYFQTPGQYEQAKMEAWAARRAAWSKKTGKKPSDYRGPHFTDPWKDWGESEDMFQWGDSDTYALDSGAEVATDKTAQWYRDQAEGQLMEQLGNLTRKGGLDAVKARRMLIMFQERQSLKRLHAKNAGADLFPEDVPVGGYGVDLKARRMGVPEPSAVQDALRPPGVPAPRPTRARHGYGSGGGGGPTLPPVRQLPDPEFDADYTQKVRDLVIKALPGNKKVYAEEAVLRSEEKMNRLKIALHELEMGSDAGPEGLAKAKIAARQALHGALPKLDFKGWDFLDQDAADALVVHALADDNLQGWEKIRVIWAVDRALRQGRLTPSEVLLFEKTFGPTVAKNLGDKKNMTMLRRIWEMGLDIWNSPRSLMASFDVSAPFRQGLVAGSRHPIIFAKNLKPMLHAMKSEDAYLSYMDEIANRENFKLYEEAKLAIMDVHGSGRAREEAFPTSLAERTPIIKHPIAGSSRAYSLFLSKTRADIFDHLVDVSRPRNAEESRIFKALGVRKGKPANDPDFLQALGRYINTSTGRGMLPGEHGEDAAQFLNSILFSPRLLASRFQIFNPIYYVNLWRQDPFVARQAAQAALQTLAGISTTLYLASRISGVEVGLNPTSSDFGKIRIGDTRIDLAGGFQPLLVLYMRMALRRTTVSATGENRELGGYGGKNQWGLLIRFMEGKMAPSPGFMRDILSDRKTFVGEPMTVGGTAQNMLTPLNTQGAIEALKNDGYSMGAIALILGSIGLGTNSYPDKLPKSSGGSDEDYDAPPGSSSGGGGEDYDTPPGASSSSGGEDYDTPP